MQENEKHLDFTSKGVYSSKKKHDKALQLARKNLKQNLKRLKKDFPGLLFQIGLLSSNEIGIVVYSNDKLNLPEQIELGNNILKVEQIPTVHFYSHSIFNYRLQNRRLIGDTGSLGLIVKSTSHDYILTCSHVITGSNINYNGYNHQLGRFDLQVLNQGYVHFNYKPVFALLNKYTDGALIHISTNRDSWVNILPNGQKLKDVIEIQQLKLGDYLYFYSSMNATFKVFMIKDRSCKNELVVNYNNGTYNTHLNLIILEAKGNNYSVGGDSGSILFDAYYRPVAMVIAGKNALTLAIPLKELLKSTGTKMK